MFEPQRFELVSTDERTLELLVLIDFLQRWHGNDPEWGPVRHGFAGSDAYGTIREKFNLA